MMSEDAVDNDSRKVLARLRSEGKEPNKTLQYAVSMPGDTNKTQEIRRQVGEGWSAHHALTALLLAIAACVVTFQMNLFAYLQVYQT